MHRSVQSDIGDFLSSLRGFVAEKLCHTAFNFGMLAQIMPRLARWVLSMDSGYKGSNRRSASF